MMPERAKDQYAPSGAIGFVGGGVLEVKAANRKGEHRMSGFVKTSSTVLIHRHGIPAIPSSLYRPVLGAASRLQ
jgi:hypothetical protein